MKFEPVSNLTKMIETVFFVDGSKFLLSALSVPKSSSVVMGCLSTAVYGVGVGTMDQGTPTYLGCLATSRKRQGPYAEVGVDFFGFYP